MFLAENIQKKWAPVLDHPDLPAIKDSYRKSVTAVLLENQEKAIAEDKGGSSYGFMTEAAPANATGSSIDNYDPVLISLVRRAMPQLIAYDVCGVQPMTGPTGLIFAMKSRFSTQGGTEALFDEANTSFSGAAGHTANGNPAAAAVSSAQYLPGRGNTTAVGEALGD